MAEFTEDEIQQLLMCIFDNLSGSKYATGNLQRNPTPFQLPNGRKVDITATIPVVQGIGLVVRDQADPENCVEVNLRVSFGSSTVDIMEAATLLGIMPGTECMDIGKLLKKSESIPNS